MTGDQKRAVVDVEDVKALESTLQGRLISLETYLKNHGSRGSLESIRRRVREIEWTKRALAALAELKTLRQEKELRREGEGEP